METIFESTDIKQLLENQGKLEFFSKWRFKWIKITVDSEINLQKLLLHKYRIRINNNL